MHATGTTVRDALEAPRAPGPGADLSARPLRVAGLGTRGVPSRYSGLESSCEGLYAALAERGHRMTVYCRAGHVPRGLGAHRGIELLTVPALRLRSLETLSHTAVSVADVLVRRRFDLVHLHAEAPGLFAPILRRFHLPVVATVQGLDWQRAKWRGGGSRVIRSAEEALVRTADEIIVVSRALQDYFAREHGRATTYIPNGVDRRARVADGKRRIARWGLEEGGYAVYVGRLVPEKRLEDLIRAFRSIDTPMRLAIVGEGGYTSEYVAHLHALTAQDPRIVFTGGQAGETLDALFQNAAAYVLPSEMEGLPMSLLEAMEHGVPAIVSDIPPHRELLGPVPDYDLFVPVHDPRALAMRLRRAFADPSRHRMLAERAREHVRERYGWPRQAIATEEVFRRALEARRR